MQAVVALRRLNKFLVSAELDPDNVVHDASTEECIKITNGNYSWSTADEKNTLKEWVVIIALLNFNQVSVLLNYGSKYFLMLQSIKDSVISNCDSSFLAW